jgi:uroporphyrin-III C-methyltransferase
LYFRSRGFEPLVVPGVSSALAGPTFAGIPVTQRGVAESLIICTGVGRKGKEIQLPGYQRSRTLVILMGVARLTQVVKALTSEEEESSAHREGSAYPLHIPVAIIERASMPDQRITFSTLKDVVKALDSIGEQRPPGMIVIGWSVLSLSGEGDVIVLDEPSDRDEERVKRWLGSGISWKVEEGVAEGWAEM